MAACGWYHTNFCRYCFLPVFLPVFRIFSVPLQYYEVTPKNKAMAKKTTKGDRVKEVKVRTTISLTPDALTKLRAAAAKANRSVSNYIEFIVSKH